MSDHSSVQTRELTPSAFDPCRTVSARLSSSSTSNARAPTDYSPVLPCVENTQ
jgi:hypothetical protein